MAYHEFPCYAPYRATGCDKSGNKMWYMKPGKHPVPETVLCQDTKLPCVLLDGKEFPMPVSLQVQSLSHVQLFATP